MRSLPVPHQFQRRQRSLSEARDLVSRWQESGQGKGAWCRREGITSTTLQSCLLRVRRAEIGPVVGGFIAVHPPRGSGQVSGIGLQIELGGGVRVVGLEVADVVAVVRGLRAGIL
jgi:hypothetical protein